VEIDFFRGEEKRGGGGGGEGADPCPIMTAALRLSTSVFVPKMKHTPLCQLPGYTALAVS